jgi:tetratricopeptide (TPR) repeat protein
MRLIYAVLVLLVVLMTFAQCQQTAKDRLAKGGALFDQGKHDEAIKAFDEAIEAYDETLKLDPTNDKVTDDKSSALTIKGLVLVDKARDLAIQMGAVAGQIKLDEVIQECDDAINASDEALKCFDEALKLHPNRFTAENGKGLALALKATAFLPVKGAALAELGKFDEAIKAYDEAIKLDPTIGLVWAGKGEALKALGNSAKADVAFAKAKELGYSG